MTRLRSSSFAAARRSQMTRLRSSSFAAARRGQMTRLRSSSFAAARRSQMTEVLEIGSGTRRRPIRRDYAAAKDAEVGKKELRRRISFETPLE